MIKKYAAYNLWANKIIVEFLTTLDSELLNVEYVSSFTSIRKTLYHIYDAEKIWYQRIIKSEHIEWPPSKHFSISENPKVILEASQKIYDLVNDSDVIKVNAQVVIEGALARAVSERGEDGGNQDLEGRYRNMLADLIAIEANNRPDENTWYPK